MTTQRQIDREPKLAQAQESIDANTSRRSTNGEIRANIQYQRDNLNLTDRQYMALLDWYNIPHVAPRGEA